MTTLRHNDYQGSVEFEDGHLVIQVLHIDDTVTTTIDSASQAQSAFAELVDDYIETCRELGKEPGKPFKGTFNVRIAPELHRQVAMSAADLGETMNAWISAALATRVERERTQKVLLGRGFAARVMEASAAGRGYTRVESIHAETTWSDRPRVFELPRALERQFAH
jgi:predicted HicB family RNase H-like nuclease